MMSSGGGGSIFDDFLGFGKKETEKKESKVKKGIEIDENLMIETISDFYCHQGYAILSLVLSFEHKQVKFTDTGSWRLAKNILTEIIKSP